MNDPLLPSIKEMVKKLKNRNQPGLNDAARTTHIKAGAPANSRSLQVAGWPPVKKSPCRKAPENIRTKPNRKKIDTNLFELELDSRNAKIKVQRNAAQKTNESKKQGWSIQQKHRLFGTWKNKSPDPQTYTGITHVKYKMCKH